MKMMILALALAASILPGQTKAEAAGTTSLPRIIVLATGGTIAGAADPRSGIGYNSGAVSGLQLIKGVPGIEKLATLSAEQISNVGSQDMNDKIWFKLARRINEIFAQNEADGVVVTHGTDTMEETAFFLDCVIRAGGPVVLVGSMRPGSATSADGPGNLYEAVQVAANPQAKGRHVMVVFNDEIHGARWVTKTNTIAVQTFRSPDAGPIGYVDPAHVRFLAAPVSQKTQYALPAGESLPRVEIVYAHANMDAVQIDNAVRDKAKGIVLAGEGGGNASQEALAALARAAKTGVVVIRSRRVPSGFVNRNVEIDDDKSGFVTSSDLNPQKARVLAQLLIANGITSPDKVQQAFAEIW